MIRKTVL